MKKNAISYEEYKKLHPATKKNRNDPMFTKEQASSGSRPAKMDQQKVEGIADALANNDHSSWEDMAKYISDEFGMPIEKSHKLCQEYASKFSLNPALSTNKNLHPLIMKYGSSLSDRLYKVASQVKRASGDLHERIAEALGWNLKEVQSFSLRALRDLVRPVDKSLAEEISKEISRF
jgi:hypothetical protein